MLYFLKITNLHCMLQTQDTTTTYYLQKIKNIYGLTNEGPKIVYLFIFF